MARGPRAAQEEEGLTLGKQTVNGREAKADQLAGPCARGHSTESRIRQLCTGLSAVTSEPVTVSKLLNLREFT